LHGAAGLQQEVIFITIDSLNVMAFDHNSSTAYIGEKMKRKTNS